MSRDDKRAANQPPAPAPKNAQERNSADRQAHGENHGRTPTEPSRERNVAHPQSEEHSRVAKGSGGKPRK